MFNKPYITPFQLGSGLAVGVLCGSWLIIPMTSILSSGRMAWFVAVLGLILGLLTVFVIVYLLTPMKGEQPLDFIVLTETLLGKKLGKIFLVVFSGLLFICLLCDLLFNGLVIFNAFYDRTPLWALYLLQVILFAYFTWGGPIKIFRTSSSLFLVIIFNIFFITLFSWNENDIGYLLPLWLWEEIDIYSPAFFTSLQNFRFAWVLVVMLYWVKSIKGISKYLVVGGTLGWLQILVLINLPILTFGSDAAKWFNNPIHPFLSTLVVPFGPVERWESISLIILQLSTFFATAIMGFSVAYILDRVFQTKRVEYWLIGMFVLAYVAIIFIPVFYYERFLYFVGASSLVVYPAFLILMILKYWKIKRGRWPLA